MSSAPVVNVDIEQFWNDPYPTLAQMRSDAPICYVPELEATLITKRDDIHTCEKNVEVFSSDQPGGLMNLLMGQNMMRRDGQDHRQERFVYYPAISPNAVKKVWAERFSVIVEDALDQLSTTNSGDLVRDYATIVSGEALKVMTGLTNITFQEMDSWSQAMIDGISNYGADPTVERRCRTATASIDEAINERLPEIQAEPDHSLLSVMVSSGMPLDNVRANIKLTISGGQNEPRDAIAGTVWTLLEHPEQLRMLIQNEVSWLSAFEEYCRWVAPIGMSPRRVAVDFEYGGVQLNTNDRIFLMFSSANRDEEHFDEPDRYDIHRDLGPSMTFGAGPHFCAGAAASRSLIGDLAVPRLFARFPEIAIDRTMSETTFGGWAFRGPLQLPAQW